MTSCSKTVLVVEDDAAIRKTLHSVLNDEGYQVAEAANGLEGLVFLRNGARPDLILLDLMMPVMDGRSFSCAVGKEPALASIPIVVITATGDCRQIQASLPVFDCLHKPLDLNRLLDVVERFVN